MIGPFWLAGTGCYSQAAMSSNDSKTLYRDVLKMVSDTSEVKLRIRERYVVQVRERERERERAKLY